MFLTIFYRMPMGQCCELYFKSTPFYIYAKIVFFTFFFVLKSAGRMLSDFVVFFSILTKVAFFQCFPIIFMQNVSLCLNKMYTFKINNTCISKSFYYLPIFYFNSNKLTFNGGSIAQILIEFDPFKSSLNNTETIRFNRIKENMIYQIYAFVRFCKGNFKDLKRKANGFLHKKLIDFSTI